MQSQHHYQITKVEVINVFGKGGQEKKKKEKEMAKRTCLFGSPTSSEFSL